MISLTAMVTTVVYLIIIGVVFGLLWWLIEYCGIPEPFHKAGRVILAVLVVLCVIGILLSLVSGQPLFKP